MLPDAFPRSQGNHQTAVVLWQHAYAVAKETHKVLYVLALTWVSVLCFNVLVGVHGRCWWVAAAAMRLPHLLTCMGPAMLLHIVKRINRRSWWVVMAVKHSFVILTWASLLVSILSFRILLKEILL